MVRKIGKKSAWGVVCQPLQHPSFFLILEHDLKNFFMNRCPKDEPIAKNLVCEKALPIPEKNWEILLGGGGWHPPLAIGGLTITLGMSFRKTRACQPEAL